MQDAVALLTMTANRRGNGVGFPDASYEEVCGPCSQGLGIGKVGMGDNAVGAATSGGAAILGMLAAPIVVSLVTYYLTKDSKTSLIAGGATVGAEVILGAVGAI